MRACQRILLGIERPGVPDAPQSRALGRGAAPAAVPATLTAATGIGLLKTDITGALTPTLTGNGNIAIDNKVKMGSVTLSLASACDTFSARSWISL